MPEMQFDFDGLIQLLAGHLYSEKKVFIRELIQNAHDAIQRRAHYDEDFSARNHGRIDIITNLEEEPGHIVFRDNGIGMTDTDIKDFLSSIGTSGTRTAREKDHVPDVIGQFGIGFLSGFVVASRVEVRTRHYTETDTENGWLWKNEGNKEYTLEPCQVKKPGTEIRVFLQTLTDRGLIQNDAVADVVRAYADMLTVPIYLNHSELPTNARIMPWEKPYASDRERDVEYLLYLEKNVPDSVLEVIPIDIDTQMEGGEPVRARGLLYVTRTRRIAGDTPRTIRVFQRRMFVCENTPEILPKWAVFINGIFNTPDLQPNAARDNFVRGDAYALLRNKLGEAVIEHFEQLKENNPERLSKIMAYHDLAIKSACDIHASLFTKFAPFLEWRVNGKSQAAAKGRDRRQRYGIDMMTPIDDYAWVTLPEIIDALPDAGDGAAKDLICFTTRSSSNQFFEMADAAGKTVVDASYPFESTLLKAWDKLHPGQIRLRYIDQEDDPGLFRDIDPEADQAVQSLANQMSVSIRVKDGGLLQVQARRFEPAGLTAVIKSNEASTGREKAESILNDPNASSDLRAMAEDLIRISVNASRRMSINASNPLIGKIAELLQKVGPEDADVVELMLGIYNDAILYNQELMTPDNAKIFHQQFGRLMSRNAEFILQRNASHELRKQVAALESKLQGTKARVAPRAHLVAFMMTPFDTSFDGSREGVRLAIEDHLGCRLHTADKVTFERFIHDNVHQHLNEADFFIADLTGPSPNVMMELGAVMYQDPRRPSIIIQRVEKDGDAPNLPVDMHGTLVMTYTRGTAPGELAAQLLGEIDKDQRLKPLLEKDGRERILSPTSIKGRMRDITLSDEACHALCQAFPSSSAWKNADISVVRDCLGESADLADIVKKRILDNC